MPGPPEFYTVCTVCGRDDVGAVRDVGLHAKGRWRVSRHGVTRHEKNSGKRVQICTGSRVQIDASLVFPREGPR